MGILREQLLDTGCHGSVVSIYAARLMQAAFRFKPDTGFPISGFFYVYDLAKDCYV